MDKKKYIGSAKLKEEPKKALKLMLSDRIKGTLQDLQNQISSIEVGGKPMSNELGNDEEDKMIGVSKWYLTELFNRIWAKFSEITGEVTQGISMVVTPTYFMGDDGCSVKIAAHSDTFGIFERIAFYKVNGETEELIVSNNGDLAIYPKPDVEEPQPPTPDFVFPKAGDTLTINETTIIRCKAQILGMEYTAQDVITHNDVIWIGAGSTYNSIFNDAHKHTMDGCCWRGNYDVTFSNGNRLFIIMGGAASRAFNRADMNGIEIAFTQSTFTDENDNVFRVYTSENTYQAGTYNVDING